MHVTCMNYTGVITEEKQKHKHKKKKTLDAEELTDFRILFI